MTIKKCDRCGQVIRGTEIPRMTVTKGVRMITPGLNMELCRDCVDSLRKWVRRDEEARRPDQTESEKDI